jgi:hypothetical protein
MSNHFSNVMEKVSALLALAERVEAASGPDRALDADVIVAIHQGQIIVQPEDTDA